MIHPFRIGLGTANYADHEECIQSIVAALEIGYRHLDTAQLYGTESALGEALSLATVPRESIVVASKVHPENMRYDDVLTSVAASRERLGVDVIDLLYVHWPVGEYDPYETLPAITELQKSGTVTHVGVSNFTPAMLDEARNVLNSPIYAHQIEMHPLWPQQELLEYAQRHDHWLVAYSPLARGHVFDVPELESIAAKHQTSIAQISLAWLLDKDNVSVIPKATGRDHLQDNFDAHQVTLEAEDIDLIDSIDRRERVMNEQDSTILNRYGAHPQDSP